MCNKRKHHKDAGSKYGPKPATVETTAGERFGING